MYNRKMADNKKKIYFYGHTKGKPYAWCSNFYSTEFEMDGVTYHCSEQAMMAEKARLMGDNGKRAEILAAKTPSVCKKKGREVGKTEGAWNQALWNKECYRLMVKILKEKFSQNIEIGQALVNTGDKMLVEAAGNDGIWGIGISVEDALVGKPWNEKNGPGTGNLLGKALVEVREWLIEEEFFI